MTREEAIDKLQDLWNEVYNEDSDGYIYAEALDMAIEALSAEAEWIPCETRSMPPEGEAVLKSDGNRIWIDETVAWWGDRSDWIGTAWMPLPAPYKGDDTE